MENTQEVKKQIRRTFAFLNQRYLQQCWRKRQIKAGNQVKLVKKAGNSFKSLSSSLGMEFKICDIKSFSIIVCYYNLYLLMTMLSFIVAARISMTTRRNSSLVSIERVEDICEKGGVCVLTKPDQINFQQEELNNVDVQRIDSEKFIVNRIDLRQDDKIHIKNKTYDFSQVIVKQINLGMLLPYADNNNDEKEGRKFFLLLDNFISFNIRKTDDTNCGFHVNNGISNGLSGIYDYNFSVVINRGLCSFINFISFRAIFVRAIGVIVTNDNSIVINDNSRNINDRTNTRANSNSYIVDDDYYDAEKVVGDKGETSNERHEVLYRIIQPIHQESYRDHERSNVSMELNLKEELISAKLMKRELKLTFRVRVDMKATHGVVNQKLTTWIKKDGLKYFRSISSSHNQSMIIQDTKISSVKQSLGQRRKKSKNSAKDIGDAVQIEGEHKNDEVVDEGVGDKSDEDIIDIDRNREMMEDVMSDVLVTKITEITITMEALIDTFVIGLVGENTHIVIMMEGTRRDYSITKMIDPG